MALMKQRVPVTVAWFPVKLKNTYTSTSVKAQRPKLTRDAAQKSSGVDELFCQELVPAIGPYFCTFLFD